MPDSGVNAGFCGPAGLARGRAMVRARAGRDTPPSSDGEAQFLHRGLGQSPSRFARHFPPAHFLSHKTIDLAADFG